MREIKIIIDGKETTAHDGMTILEAAEKIGVHIPTLCHSKELTPTGVCRICVVEVKGSDKLVAACHTPIVDGMDIHTQTKQVASSRRATLELVLAAHTGPCVLDPRCERCDLHKIAAELELGRPRFRLRQPRSYPVEEMSPYVRRDLSKCILCYRCIKACEEIAKKSIYSMGYRGFDSKVIVDCDEPLNKEVCRDCGVCIDYCPTSALERPEGLAQTAMPMKKRGTEEVEGANASERNHRKKLLEILNAEQRRAGFISPKVIPEIARNLNIGVSEVYGVVTFYSFLSTRTLGKNVIRICKSLPCYLKDAPMIIKSVERVIGIKPGETTTDGKFSFLLTNCIGVCDQAPVMLVNHDVHGNLTPDKISDVLKLYS